MVSRILLVIFFIHITAYSILCITADFPNAESVSIAGTWNNWAGAAVGNFRPQDYKMVKLDDGKWHYPDELIPEGKCRYKFYVDKRWEEVPERETIIKHKEKEPSEVKFPVNNISQVNNKINEGYFTYNDSSADIVSIAGTFNNWNPNTDILKKNSSGLWEIRLNLKPGKYEYKFVVNGDNWVEDPNNPDKIKDDFGGGNKSVVTITGSNSIPETKVEKQTQAVLFEIEVPGANSVEVWGGWNNWSKGIPLKKYGDKWKIKLKLKPGKYEYKFLKDGDWDVLNKDNRTIEVK